MPINMRKTSMDELQREAMVSLKKNGVNADGKGGIKVRLVLDHSGSMRRWYDAGAVQRLTEQVLGLASALDDDGTIEVWYFGSDVSERFEVDLNPQTLSLTWLNNVDPHYVGWVDRTHNSIPWGSTNYPAGLKAPVDFQKLMEEDEPALVIFQTDGGPDSRYLANLMLKDLSGEKTFFAFVVFGAKEDEDSLSDVGEYMDSLDTLEGRVRDNASVFFTGELETYATLSDSAVYDGVLGEFVGQWLPQVL